VFPVQLFTSVGLHWTHVWLVPSHTPRPALVQSLSLRQPTQEKGGPRVSHTGVEAGQSALELHGSLMQVPTEPFICVQCMPEAQLVTPPSSTRQPVVQTPEATEEVSQ
jgi:hypothetical protein